MAPEKVVLMVSQLVDNLVARLGLLLVDLMADSWEKEQAAKLEKQLAAMKVESLAS